MTLKTWISSSFCFAVLLCSGLAQATNEAQVGLMKATPPVASLMPYAGKALDEAASGWMLCDGRELPVPQDKTDRYWSLYQAIGDTYGTAEQGGHKHFKLPDLRGRVPVGLDNMGGKDAGTLSASGEQQGGVNGNQLGAKGGEEKHKLIIAEMPGHSHGVKDPGHQHPVPGNGGGNFIKESGNFKIADRSGRETPLTDPSVTRIEIEKAGGEQPHNNMQPSIILNYIIRVR